MTIPLHQIQRRVTGFSRQSVTAGDPHTGVDRFAAADVAMAKRIGAVLERHYPSHPWLVEVTHAQGVAYLSLPIIMHKQRKYVLHLDRLAVDPGFRSVIRAAGEILERHNVPRSGFRLDRFLDARAAAPHNRPRLIIPRSA